jgi:hypothetical protein
MADRPVVLVWAKRLWRCPDPDCQATTWSEEVDEIAPRVALTERARAEICRLVVVARDVGDVHQWVSLRGDCGAVQRLHTARRLSCTVTLH